jgi:hypothetical protein
MFEEGKARKEASKAREEKGKLAKRQEERQILTSKMNQIVQVLKSKLWKEFDPYQKKNIYDKYKELMGKFMPGYTLPDLDATKFGEGAAAAVRQAMTDGFTTVNSKQTTEEKQLDMMGHWQKLINNPEAWAVLKGSFNKSEEEKAARKEGQFNADVEILKQERQGKIDASDDRVKAALKRGNIDPEYGIKVANAVTVKLGEETPPQAGVPSPQDFTLGSLDKYGETGKYGDLERMPEKVTPPKTPTKIQVAMRAAGIPTETPIGEMSEDDAVKVLVKLKEYGGTQGDFFSFLDEKAKYHRGSGFTGFLHRVLDYFTSGGYGEEDEKVLKSVLDK